ncbi:hypothetical protein PICMEDRAFT_28899 [Pichia membranifaciens NRRL Y-2026]|uniref:N-acetyltransferase domain-containing protein n=1 Tax=Pichia membranifaciens NRRL Y-2026 TaxID=763406 RepID=A0A1E3NSB0_9ASCO|nr:hypothetical protein PICMEDRAFT_28899 [Pichia membranifaciens NRRL Y-2026]ODQ49015.1 hypothetical protein PICMEDRAFT_28899 [Pichia membranifaciens NRRL Y-2026]
MSRPQHLCIRPLNVPDIAQVLGLEMQGFPSHERASALRIEYRLTVCPELCSGLFVREFDTEAVNAKELPDHSTIKKETLIGHVIGTKMVSEAITDESMLVPSSFVPGHIYPLGHQDSGRTIGIHSVVVHPDYRGKKLASLLLKDYLQKMNQQYVADNVSLLCLEKLVAFYSGVGFADKGVSACKFAGEEWHDMALTLDHDEDEEE